MIATVITISIPESRLRPCFRAAVRVRVSAAGVPLVQRASGKGLLVIARLCRTRGCEDILLEHSTGTDSH